jgi:hypothetical protein
LETSVQREEGSCRTSQSRLGFTLDTGRHEPREEGGVK